MNDWVSLSRVMEVIRKAKAGEWRWYWNTRCKYIELRIDMRDGHCLIRDREGVQITLEQLQHQVGDKP